LSSVSKINSQSLSRPVQMVSRIVTWVLFMLGEWVRWEWGNFINCGEKKMVVNGLCPHHYNF
jgi:hypothetical protein